MDKKLSESEAKLQLVDCCPLCGGGNVKQSVNTKPIQVLSCETCSLQFSEYQMKESDVITYYENDFSSIRHRQGQLINAMVNIKLLRSIHPDLDMTNFADVGCGYGYMIRKAMKAKSDQARLFGLEISKVERSYAASMLGESVEIVDRIEELPDETFSLIVCCEVIEHVKDPKSFLNSLHKKLQRNGTLFLLTDNFGSSYVKSMGPYYKKWIPHSHIVHFNSQSFKELFRLSAFQNAPEVFYYTSPENHVAFLVHKLKELLGLLTEVDFNNYRATEFNRKLTFFAFRYVLNWVLVRFRPSNSDGTLMFTAVRKR